MTTVFKERNEQALDPVGVRNFDLFLFESDNACRMASF